MAKQISWTDYVDKLELTLTKYLVDKAPGLDQKWKAGLVKLMPWLALVFGLLGLIGGLTGLGALSFLSPLLLVAGKLSGVNLVALCLSLVESVLMLMAFSPLRKKLKKGWRLLFYSMLLGAVSTLLSLSILGMLLTVMFFYLLFQLKESYKD